MLRLSATYWTKYHAKQLVLYRTAPVLMILLLDNKIIEKQKQRIISLEQVFKTWNQYQFAILLVNFCDIYFLFNIFSFHIHRCAPFTVYIFDKLNHQKSLCIILIYIIPYNLISIVAWQCLSFRQLNVISKYC